MGVSYKDYSQFGNATITVSNSKELNAAVKKLAAEGGGTVKVNPNGGPYDLSLNNVGSSKSPVLIESGGKGQPVFESMNIIKSEYITIDGVAVDTSHMGKRPNWEEDVKIDNSSNIELVNSSFTGSAKGYLTEATSTDVRGVSAVFIKGSDDVNLSGNFFTNYMYNVKVVDTKGIKFNHNEVTQWQADAFHAGGIQDAEINDNWLHNPLGSTQTLAHTDFIQVRMANTSFENRDIEIARNLMDTEGGPAAQGIHMGTSGTDGKNYNVSIHDNVIHTALPRGIGVDATRGLDVYNNTVLWDEASWIEATPGAEQKSWDPRILVTGRDINVDDNITSSVRVNNQLAPEGNYIVQYDNKGAANYADKHITNLDGSGNPNSYDLSILKSSPLYGKMGAAMSSDGNSFTPPPTSKPDPDPAPPVAEPDDQETSEPVVREAETEARDIEVTLRLLDTESDEIIGELEPGDTIDASFLGSDAVSIVAELSEPVGSVKLSLGEWSQTENAVPYTLFGDRNGDYYDPEDAPFVEPGSYTLTVELFEGRDGIGKIGETSAEFSVAAPEPEPEAPSAAPVVAPPVVQEAEVPDEEPVETPVEDPVPMPPVEEPVVTIADDPVDAPAPNAPAPDAPAEPEPEVETSEPVASRVPEDEDDGNIISQILNAILSILGAGDDDDDSAPAAAAASGGGGSGSAAIVRRAEASLDEVVGVTEWLGDEPQSETDEDDEEDEDSIAFAA